MIHEIITRGTTPTQSFELPFDTAEIENLSVTYKVKNTTLLKKYLEDCKFNTNIINIDLDQTDTLLFPANKNVEVQIKILTKQNKIFAFGPYRIKIQEIFDQEEMV